MACNVAPRLLGFSVPCLPLVYLCVLWCTYACFGVSMRPLLDSNASLHNTYRSATSDYPLSERAWSLSHGIVRYTSTATWSGLACGVWSHGTGRHTAVQVWQAHCPAKIAALSCRDLALSRRAPALCAFTCFAAALFPRRLPSPPRLCATH